MTEPPAPTARQQDASALTLSRLTGILVDAGLELEADSAAYILAALPPSAPPALDVEWGRLGYVLGLIGPVDMDDTEDAYVTYTEQIRETYRRTDLESDPQFVAYVARLAQDRSPEDAA